jgi:hypothetical protein
MDHTAKSTRSEKPRRTLPGTFMALAVLVAALAAACSTPGAPSAAPTGPGASGAAIPADMPLLGAWVTEITKADLAAAGIEDAGLQNENSGRFTWTFAPDGTWSQVQESLDGSPINSPVFRGTYTVDGVSVVATTTFPEQYADDGLHYTFAVSGTEVTFDVADPPDPLLEAIVETHPWSRPG